MSVTLSIALILLVLAILLLLRGERQRTEAGLPGGRVIYTDTRAWGRVEKPLFHNEIGLTGKPDYLVEKEGLVIPVEVKSGRAPDKPYDSHIFQLAAYCLLVEKTYGRRPPYGIIHYNSRDFAVDYTPELEAALLDQLAEMKRDEYRTQVDRSHAEAARCRGCGFRKICDQKLTGASV
jgi:CRISPR-associated exonuclease Cas4